MVNGDFWYLVFCFDFGLNFLVVFYLVMGEVVCWFFVFSSMINYIICSVRCLVCVGSGVFKGEYFCEVLVYFLDCLDCLVFDSC